MIGEDFIAFAGKIALLHREEAAVRSAVSRAYYGAFHIASRFLQDLGLTVDHSHGYLQHDFLNCGLREGAEVGVYLQELQSHRIDADYRLAKSTVASSVLAQGCVLTAKDVESRIILLRQQTADGATKQNLANQIVAYRRLVGRRA